MEAPSRIASALWPDEQNLSDEWRGHTAPVLRR